MNDETFELIWAPWGYSPKRSGEVLAGERVVAIVPMTNGDREQQQVITELIASAPMLDIENDALRAERDRLRAECKTHEAVRAELWADVQEQGAEIDRLRALLEQVWELLSNSICESPELLANIEKELGK